MPPTPPKYRVRPVPNRPFWRVAIENCLGRDAISRFLPCGSPGKFFLHWILIPAITSSSSNKSSLFEGSEGQFGVIVSPLSKALQETQDLPLCTFTQGTAACGVR